MINNDSTFSIFKIGPKIAELISLLDKETYYFKIANYHAVLWDWDGKHPSYVGSIDESCFILTTSKEKHPTYSDNICLSYKFNNPRDDNDICLGLNNYNHNDYQNIIDGKITFYDYENDQERLINIPYIDTIYSFIDYSRFITPSHAHPAGLRSMHSTRGTSPCRRVSRHGQEIR